MYDSYICSGWWLAAPGGQQLAAAHHLDDFIMENLLLDISSLTAYSRTLKRFPASSRVWISSTPHHNSCCPVAQSCPTLCDPMDCSTPGFSVLHYLLESAQTHVHWVSEAESNHLILCHPLLLLPSIFPSIRVFSSELALYIRWPKNWSFSFSISPSNEYSRLISLRTDWFDLLAVQGTLKSLL